MFEPSKTSPNVFRGPWWQLRLPGNRIHRRLLDLLLSPGDGCLAFDDAQHFLLADDHVLLAVELDLGAGILAEEDAVPRLDVEGNHFALVVLFAAPHGDDFSLLGLLLGRVGNDDPALRSLLLFNPLDQDSIMEWSKIHMESPFAHASRTRPNYRRCSGGATRNSKAFVSDDECDPVLEALSVLGARG